MLTLSNHNVKKRMTGSDMHVVGLAGSDMHVVGLCMEYWLGVIFSDALMILSKHNYSLVNSNQTVDCSCLSIP